MMDQTHIGYTNWQEPPKNTLPKVEEIEVPERGAIGVAMEGSKEFWPGHSGELELPRFSAIDRDRYYFEVFNRGTTPLEYTVVAEAPWLRIERDHAGDESDGTLAKEQRFWVTIDPDQLPTGEQRASIMVKAADGTTATIVASVADDAAGIPQDFRGHVDTHGCVSIEAEHFSQAVGTDSIEWQVIPSLGRTLSGVTPMPATADAQALDNGTPHLEYRVHLSRGGPIEVQAFVSPTLNFTNGEGLRYAVSFDDQPPQLVNIHAGENLQAWEKWVADNANVTSSEHHLDKAGEHTLKFWMVDPGIVLQKLVVDTGGLQASYLGPPESTRWPMDAN